MARDRGGPGERRRSSGRGPCDLRWPRRLHLAAWYEEKRLTGKVVPTWNYVTVQAHGTLTLHPEPEWLLPHVRRLVERHEARRPEPWSIDDAPDGYVETQVRAIVGLELRIDRLEAKRKLSQNRSAGDIAGAIEGLDAGSPEERDVAAAMRSARDDPA